MKVLKNKIVKNSAWIIGCRLGQAVIALFIGMITARYLGPTNYGTLSYAASITAFVMPIMQLGLSNILVQELVQSPDKEGEILGTTLLLTGISSLVCIIGIIVFVGVVNAGEQDTLVVCGLYSIILFFQSVEMMQYWFQAKLKSKYTAITILISYATVAIYKVFLLMTGKSLYWFAVTTWVESGLVAISLLVIYRRLGGKRLQFSMSLSKSMLLRGRYYIISSLMVVVFAQTDRIMLKIMIDSTAVGYYTAATTIAGMTSFVFGALIDTFRPIILEAKLRDGKMYKNNMCRLYAIIIYVSLIQSIFMTLFASPMVNIMYGSNYSASVVALRIVVWYTTFSYMGSVRNIWILSERKHKFLWMINLSGAITNVILNIMFIPILGIIGAAIASLVTQFFTNFLIGFIIKPIRENNKLILQSLKPKFIKENMIALLRR